jgi:hypothetical protein
MTTIWAALLAFIISAGSIVVLWSDDPKRRRVMERYVLAMLPRQRPLLVALACLPALGCVLLANAAAFILWLGACAHLGWACAA